jgi:hypothetical protein
MTTDARRLMRLGPAARKERSSNGHTRVRSALGAVVASGKTVFPDQEKLLLGLSRMKENFQVRFLEGGRAGNSPLPLGSRHEVAAIIA